MAIPYQPAHRIQPTYGFRYGAQPHTDNVAPKYNIPTYEFPESTSGDNKAKTLDTTQNMTSNFEGNEDSDNSVQNASNQLSLNAAQNVPNPSGRQVHQPYSSPMDALGFLSPVPIQSSPAVPKTGFGADGTVSGRTGGIFKDGRSYDPLTGYANQEWSSPLAWRNYMTTDFMGSEGNRFPNVLGDVNNAFDYKRGDSDKILERQFAEDKGIDTNIETNPDWTKKFLLDKGIPQHSFADSDGNLDKKNPSVLASNIDNYVMVNGKLAAPPGSQFTKTNSWFGGTREEYEALMREQGRGKYSKITEDDDPPKRPDGFNAVPDIPGVGNEIVANPVTNTGNPGVGNDVVSNPNNTSYQDASGGSYDGDPGQDSRGDSYSGLFSSGGHVQADNPVGTDYYGKSYNQELINSEIKTLKGMGLSDTQIIETLMHNLNMSHQDAQSALMPIYKNTGGVVGGKG